MAKPVRQTKARDQLANELAEGISGQDARVAGRVLSLIDNRDPMAKAVLKRLYARTGRAHVVGFTGSAGSGKSTLIGCVTAELRRRKKQVGILTIDPTSPFSGGALLGDRIRMREHFLDQGVFIRSLATRGNQGGLSGCVHEAAQLLDAMGKEYILIETIGIGQDQVDIARIAHTVVLLITPESGDEIQGMKAGILEVADLLVINKADLPGADELYVALTHLLDDRDVQIFKTSARNNEGIAALVDGIENHRAVLLTSGRQQQRTSEISRNQLLALVRDELMSKLKNKTKKSDIDQWAQKIAERKSDPYTAAEAILGELGF
jgi:LAO/AO transport system kinase